MHLSEGVLSGQVLLAGAVASAGGLYMGVKRLRDQDVPKVGLLSGAFFVGSLIHIPLGPTSVHLVLNGLVGLLLGWLAFPAILVGLVLQAVLFQFGGFTTLGVNLLIMAGPGVLVYYLFRSVLKTPLWWAGAFGAGVTGVGLGALGLSTALYLSGEGFVTTAKLALLSHLPVAGIEGVVTAIVVGFLKKTRPEVLEAVR
ncbi:MAG: cobalt transporter CbiM [Nitrospirae bacterium]|nr:MAG: cobalt transporter CbiM [Nitrospirota bacterium]